ncbi:MAG: bifunctional oligoribonuclease/PAP phosphatase NrnA [Endomicrobium sp.]|jgi:phosphoesterase RecJ-like protein|nr:bifunctional oligoribonuclease/PAP phosphatase NrnA [Endomicrobium sp.]
MKNLNLSDFEKISEISKIIRSSKTFFIAGHVRPDGDSLGSALALASVLERLKKKVSVCCYGKIPDSIKFLSGIDKIKKNVKKNYVFDCAIILESIDFSRMGNIINEKQAKKIINIDHHFAYTNFGDVNYVDSSSSSTAELVLNVLEYMKIEPTKNEAENLYVGILTDTGCFQQANTTINSHISCAKLMKFDININNIYKNIYECNSIDTLKLHGMLLCKIKTIFNNCVSYIVLKKNMLKKNKNVSTDSIINYTLKIKDTKIGCFFREIDKKRTKVSCRSVNGFDILEIMRKFNGGGHKNAAGCIINAGLNNSIKIIINELKSRFNFDKIKS